MMQGSFSVLVMCAFFACAHGAAVELTKENYEATIAGKNSFVRMPSATASLTHRALATRALDLTPLIPRMQPFHACRSSSLHPGMFCSPSVARRAAHARSHARPLSRAEPRTLVLACSCAHMPEPWPLLDAIVRRCGHCKAMKPAWDELGSEFEGSSSVVIGDVDCTSDGGKALCEEHEVRGYPTVKYFNGDTGEKGEKYSGARDKDTLVKFVQDNLSAKCALADTSACSEKEVGYIDKMKGDKVEAGKQLERLKGMKGNSMAPDLKKWLNQRIAILEQIVA